MFYEALALRSIHGTWSRANRIANIAPKISVLDLSAGRPRNGIACVTPRISGIGACDCQFGKVEIPLIFFSIHNYSIMAFFVHSLQAVTHKKPGLKYENYLWVVSYALLYISMYLQVWRHSTRDEEIERYLGEWRRMIVLNEWVYCMIVTEWMQEKKYQNRRFFWIFSYNIQHCFIYRPSDSTSRTIAILAWMPEALTTRLDLIHTRLDLIRIKINKKERHLSKKSLNLNHNCQRVS
jgi:hypothetical protein